MGMALVAVLFGTGCLTILLHLISTILNSLTWMYEHIGIEPVLLVCGILVFCAMSVYFYQTKRFDKYMVED